jgi:hypothetical protein
MPDNIYLDLANEHWRAVVDRTDGGCGSADRRICLPLPVPEPGGSIEALNSFLNLASQNDFALIVAWLLAAL